MRHTPFEPACLLVAAALCISGCAPADQLRPTMSRLRAEGTKIVNDNSEEVILKGVNLGGWMFHETWITLLGQTTAGQLFVLAQSMGSDIEAAVLSAMRDVGTSYGVDPAVIHVCHGNSDEWYDGWIDRKGVFHQGFRQRLIDAMGESAAAPFLTAAEQLPAPLCDDSDLGLRAVLSQRFQPSGRDEALAAFRAAWLTEDDVAWIAAQGFNLVRAPIGYRSLMTGPDSAKPQTLQWNEQALTELDRLLDWCERHGVYAIIDIQEAPGGQNTYAGVSGLYDDPHMQDLTVALWEKLSDRFIHRNSVAAYSLLAEPYGAPTVDARDAMYDRLVKAIRARGDDHLCIIHDGFKGMKSLPAPGVYNWTNVAYSTHLFEWSLRDYDSYEFMINYIYSPVFSDARSLQQVPYYIGSFSTIFDEEWAYQSAGLMASWMNEQGWSWSLWTYKRLDDPLIDSIFGVRTSWGLRRGVPEAFKRPDPYLDDIPALKRKFAAYRSYGADTNQKLLRCLLTPEQCIPSEDDEDRRADANAH